MGKAVTPYIKEYLMTAGPTPVPPSVMAAASEPIVYHRAPAFLELYERVLRRLKQLFQTENEVLVFAASGSGAMESAVANIVSPGQTVLVASCGKFGERWKELCDAYGAETIHLKSEWGEKIDPGSIEKALAGADGVEAVFTTQSETSTGVVNDIEAIAEVCRQHDAVLCVDAVSGMGVVDLPTDDWGIDVVVSGSQKALMCPPGLGFASVSEKALQLASKKQGGRYYFDWEKTAKAQKKSPPSTPFTPAVSLMAALDAALELIEDEGLENVFARHAMLGRAARAAVQGAGLELFGLEDENANVVTTVKVPDGVDGKDLVKLIRDKYGITLAGGQGHLKGEIVRIAHCGHYGAFDILTAIAALEMALEELGAGIDLGSGVACAQKVFVESGERAAA